MRGTSLGEHVKDYTFFSYGTEESLHISSREKQEVIECFQRIRKEVRHDIDIFSKVLISRNIELFLDYCRRFYERQFITRHVENAGMLQQLDTWLDEYIQNSQLKTRGIPNEMYCANALHLSPAYFSDLLRHETGMDIQEYVQAVSYTHLDVYKRQVLGIQNSQGAYDRVVQNEKPGMGETGLGFYRGRSACAQAGGSLPLRERGTGGLRLADG